MEALLEQICLYLINKVSTLSSENVSYYEASDADEYVLVTERLSRIHVPIQINASQRYVRITVRSTSNTSAQTLANECYVSFIDEDLNGSIILPNGTQTGLSLSGRPVWDKTDQQGRKYFYFDLIIYTTR